MRFVVDVIPTDSYVRCDPASLLDFCAAHDCSVLRRTCFEEPLEPTAIGTAANRAVANALTKLAGKVVLSDAPSGYSVLRVIATTQPCAEIKQDTVFDCARLLGCAASCPVDLDGFSGDLPTELDLGSAAVADNTQGHILFDEVCAPGVAVCSRTPFNRQQQCGATRTGMRCK